MVCRRGKVRVIHDCRYLGIAPVRLVDTTKQPGERRVSIVQGLLLAVQGLAPTPFLGPVGHTRPRVAASAQATDQVRLEGHGVNDRAFNPSEEPKGEMWLPLAPTGRPTVFPAGGGGNTRSSDVGAAARLVAQQAMDEARLDRSGESTGGTTAPRGGGQPRQDETSPSSSWCCICSEDATLRCRQCEDDSGQGEPELFCSRCFREVHRDDPEMQAHGPQALSGEEGARHEEGVGRKGFRGWRKRK